MPIATEVHVPSRIGTREHISIVDYPVVIASAKLERTRYSWVWAVDVCPYCGKAHEHYAGPLDGAPRHPEGYIFRAYCDLADRQRIWPTDPMARLSYVLAIEAPPCSQARAQLPRIFRSSYEEGQQEDERDAAARPNDVSPNHLHHGP